MARHRHNRFQLSTEEDSVVSSINTTPLVDVMLVMLIIFLITIPVVLQTAQVELPKERNVPTQTTPENVVLSVDQKGKTYWNDQVIKDSSDLIERLRVAARKDPQPEVHIRGDQDSQYEPIGRIMLSAQRVGIAKIAFITEPPTNN